MDGWRGKIVNREAANHIESWVGEHHIVNGAGIIIRTIAGGMT